MRKLVIIITIGLLAALGVWLWPKQTTVSPPLTTLTSDFSPLFTPITINTIPSQAEVRINDTLVGSSPISLSNLTDTSYRVTIKKQGFIELKVLLVPKESGNVITVQLQPLSGNSEENIETPIATTAPSSTPTTAGSPQENIDTTDINNTLADLEKNDPNIPFELAGKVSVPTGYRFPDNSDLSKPVPLEIIPPALVADSDTKKMPALERNVLLANLKAGYMFDPVSQGIIPMDTVQSEVSIINFGHFEPANLSIPNNKNLTWFNQSPNSCQLRTDPKSPQLINQTIPSQGLATITFSQKGIYIFFCQGNPGPTQTLVVS